MRCSARRGRRSPPAGPPHEHRGRVVGEAAGHVEPGGRQRHDLLADDLALRERLAPRRDRLALVIGADVGGGRLQRATQLGRKRLQAARAARQPGRRTSSGSSTRSSRAVCARTASSPRARTSATMAAATVCTSAPAGASARSAATVAATSSFHGSCLISPPARRASWSPGRPPRRAAAPGRRVTATRCALQPATTWRDLERRHPGEPGAQPGAKLDHAVGEAERGRQRRFVEHEDVGLRAYSGEVPARGLRVPRGDPRAAVRPACPRASSPAPVRHGSARGRASRRRRTAPRGARRCRSLRRPGRRGRRRAGCRRRRRAARRRPDAPGAPAPFPSRSEATGRPAASSRSRNSGSRLAGLAGEADPHLSPNASAISRAPPLNSRPSARCSV